MLKIMSIQMQMGTSHIQLIPVLVQIQHKMINMMQSSLRWIIKVNNILSTLLKLWTKMFVKIYVSLINK